MKNIITTIAIVFLAISTFAQSNNLAKVYVVNGIEAYIMNEPVRNYEVVFTSDPILNFTNLISQGVYQNSISTRVGKYVNSALRKGDREGLKFDAIVYNGAKQVSAIRFLDEATDENRQVARIHRLNGILIYSMCDPLTDFSVAYSKRKCGNSLSHYSYGVINNSIEQDMARFARRYKRKYRKNKIDAIYYTGGKRCEGILFK